MGPVLRWSGKYYSSFVDNLISLITVQTLWKSVHIWRISPIMYNIMSSFSMDHSVVVVAAAAAAMITTRQSKWSSAVSWQYSYISTFFDDHKPSKLGQIDLVLVCDQFISTVSLCIQDYKCLRIAVMICASMVNTHTHTQTAIDRLYY